MHNSYHGRKRLTEKPFRSLFLGPSSLWLSVVVILLGSWASVPQAGGGSVSPGLSLEVLKDDVSFGDADGNSYPSPGDTIMYEVVLINDGDDDLSGICFTDRPDSNTTLVVGSVDASSGPATILSGNDPGDTFVRVCVGDLAPNDTGQVIFLVIITDPLPPGVCEIVDQGEAISNELPVELSDDPTTPTNDDPTITYVCSLPLVDAYKTYSLFLDADMNGYPSPGDTLMYVITITSEGNVSATQCCLIDTPDVNTTLVTGSVFTSKGSVLEGNTPGDTRLQVCFGTMSPGDEVEIICFVAINDPLPPSLTEVVNQGWVISNELPPQPTDNPETPEEDDPTVTPLIYEPILEVYKRDILFVDPDEDGVPSPGDLLLYTVYVQNLGYASATGIVFTDTIDANTQMVTNSIGTVFTSQGLVISGNSIGDTIVRVEIGTIDPMGLVEISFQVTISDPVIATYIENQGFISSNETPEESSDDPDTPTDDDPTITLLNAEPVLAASKNDVLIDDADGNGLFSPGDILRYDVTLRNVGNAAATEVVFTDYPDSNTELIVGSVTTNQGSVVIGNNPGNTYVLIDVGTILPLGLDVEITFEVTIPASVTLSIQPPISIAKPDSHFTVCVDVGCFEETYVADQGVVSCNEQDSVFTDDFDTPEPVDSTITNVAGVVFSGISFTLTFDTTIVTFDSTISFLSTCLESLGWFPAWDFGATHDSLKVWLLGGGNTTDCCSCYAYIGFHVNAAATPGDSSLIHFEECVINEGDPVCNSEDGIFIVNRPPVFASVQDTIYFIEAHEQCLTVTATDPDGDFMVMWAVIDTCADTTGAVFGVSDTVTGIGSVEGDFCWCPIKEDSCDTVDVIFYVKSTMPDSLMDTLSVTIIVQNTFIHAMFPDTTYYPCGWMETFFCIDPNYVDCIDTLGIFSLDVILSYDPDCIHVTEVGNVGTLTETWGTITYNIVNGTILISLSGEDTLRWCDTTLAQSECVNLFYVGFKVDPEAVPGDTCWLCIEHVKVNEGWPPAYWDECTEIGCAAIAIECLSISGNVSYCSTDVAIPDVEMKMSGYAADTVLTDSSGDYEFPCVFACGDYCVKPQKEWLPPQVVNSFDGSLILQSLVNLFTMGPCEMVAADVSGDGTITGYDAALLLRWRVGLPVPGHTGEWKFNPDSLCYNRLTAHMLNQDYWGIIIGDVSLNWPGDGPPKPRSGADGTSIVFSPKAASPGGTFTLPIVLETTQPIYSADLTLHYDAQVLSPTEALCTELTVDFATAYKVDEGQIRVAMAGAKPVLGGGPILRILFEVSEEIPEGASSQFDLIMTLNETYTIARSESFTAQPPVPQEYGLSQNYPNPFNPETVITYQLPEDGYVTLNVYNVLGQEITTLVDESKEAGYYSIRWKGQDSRGLDVASGVYYYRIEVEEFTSTRRMLLLK